MLIIETVTINGTEYKKSYSDAGFMIEQEETGVLYSEAIDTITSEFTYTETSIPIDGAEEEATVEDYEQALEDLGVV